MQVQDLQKIVHLAQSQNLQKTARHFHITAGALSKTLKKTEQSLNTELFERIGRHLQLNANGRQFVIYARQIIHEYEQMQSEFNSQEHSYKVKCAGPAILLNHCSSLLLDNLNPSAEVELAIQFEGDALKQVVAGQAHMAIVTGEVLAAANKQQLKHITLGSTCFRLALSASHPLAAHKRVKLSEVLDYAFVCPNSSPFCGIERGKGSDGWPDKQHQRKISYRTGDFSTLVCLVKNNHALAYMPDFAIAENGLMTPDIEDFTYQYQEQYHLLYKPSMAHGWLNQFIAKFP